MITDEIRDKLFTLQDKKYRDFQSKLIPTIAIDNVIGVRTPELRKYAKELSKRGDIKDFLNVLPHQYFDENQLHAFIVSEIKDFDLCIKEVCRFLPCVDNWATCDQMSPKIFKKHHSELLKYIKEWLSSDKTYVVRFAIGMLMEHFLNEDFEVTILILLLLGKLTDEILDFFTFFKLASFEFVSVPLLLNLLSLFKNSFILSIYLLFNLSCLIIIFNALINNICKLFSIILSKSKTLFLFFVLLNLF